MCAGFGSVHTGVHDCSDLLCTSTQ